MTRRLPGQRLENRQMNLPPGFGTVTPYFFVANAEAFIRFLEDAFGGRESGCHHRAHIDLRRDP